MRESNEGGFSQRTAEGVLQNLIAPGVLAVIAAVALSVWASFQSWDGPLVGLFIFGLIVLLAFGLNQFRILQERWKRSRQKRHLRETIIGWLIRQDFSTKDAALDPEMSFSLAAERQSLKIQVSRFTKDDGYIVIGAGVKASLEKRMGEVRSSLADSLTLEFARMRIGFTLSGSISDLHFAVSEKVLLDDSFSEFLFAESLKSVMSALVIAETKFRQETRKLASALMLMPSTSDDDGKSRRWSASTDAASSPLPTPILPPLH